MPFAGAKMPVEKILINPTRRRMMRHLAQSDGRSTFMRLHAATTTAKSRSGTSNQLHILERAGFVALRHSWDSYDGRDCRPCMHVTLTDNGRAALEKQELKTTPRAEAAPALEVHP